MKDVGGGDESQVNKSAICSAFALTFLEPNSAVIGDPPLWRKLVCLPIETAHPNTASGSHVSGQQPAHIHPLRKKTRPGQREEGDGQTAEVTIHKQK